MMMMMDVMVRGRVLEQPLLSLKSVMAAPGHISEDGWKMVIEVMLQNLNMMGPAMTMGDGAV
jgi:hypothetical protein